MPRPAPRYTATLHTAENSLGALENIAGHLDTFLAAIRKDVGFLAGSDVDGEIAYLRETVSEHFYGQFREAFEALDEREWSDPLKVEAA